MAAATAIERLLLALAMAAGLTAAQGQSAPRVRLLVPGCAAALPLDAGQAFAGPRFLVWDNRIAFFAQAPPPGQGGREPEWRLCGSERLPAAPPAAGLDRARVKWRDGTLWMKAGTRVYRRDTASGQWFPAAEPGLEFRDFDVDLKGRILLIATADPRTGKYRALLEAVGPDRVATEILAEYPDPDYPAWFDRISPVAAATLLTGYEGVQIQEYLVLSNPLARRVFIYKALDGTLKEAALGLPTRDCRALAALAAHAPGAAPADLCWQVLPKGGSEAWLVHPALDPDGTEGSEPPAPGLKAMVLDLAEGRGGAPMDLPGCHVPVFPDPRGRLVDLAEALGRFGRLGRASPDRAAQAPW